MYGCPERKHHEEINGRDFRWPLGHAFSTEESSSSPVSFVKSFLGLCRFKRLHGHYHYCLSEERNQQYQWGLFPLFQVYLSEGQHLICKRKQLIKLQGRVLIGMRQTAQQVLRM